MRKHFTPLLLTYFIAVPAFDTGATTMRSTEQDTTNLSEIEVTAARKHEGLISTSPIHTLDSRRILKEGVTDISDALRRLPGINLRDYGGSGGMKTVSVRGLGTQHTGVQYDGVMLGDVQGGQIDLSRYTLDNLSGLSLSIGDNDDIFQPARSISSASTLSVSTIRQPDMMSRKPTLTVRLRAGSFGMLNPSFHSGFSNGSNLGMTLSGEYIHARNNYPFVLSNGVDTRRERRENSQINSGHAEWNGIWKPTTGSSLQAKIYWYDNSHHLPGPVIYYNSESNERLRDRNIFGQLNYNARLSSKVSIKALAKYNWSNTRYQDKNAIYPGGEVDHRYTQREEYGAASVLYLPIHGLSFSYSADFWHNSLADNTDSNGRPQRNSLLQSISAKWEIWRITATARGLLSLIHDSSTAVSESKDTRRFSPSIGLSVQPVEGRRWHIRASYKNIMRMPTFNELYFDHYGTINLNPEVAEQINFGTTLKISPFSWLSDLELTADGYLNHVRNKIVAMPYNMFVWTMTNLGRVRILGADMSVRANIRLHESHHLIFSGNYSYQRAASRTDRNTADWMKQVPYTPLNSGAMSLAWENPWVNFVAHTSGCSSRYSTTINIPSTRIGGYMEFGFTLYRTFRIKSVRLEARADMLNAFDHQYEIVARYPMPGRSFNVTLSLTI